MLVNEGEAGVWDGPRSARDVEQIVTAIQRFWGSLPYERYVFLNLMTEASGGLEHRNSTRADDQPLGDRSTAGAI